ncbi:MAG: acyl-CoA synthetase (AMP-forming)/AMP-acid ligase II [Gammaproteobacteria bacterium]|nr:acyl-CoA synthetase (AMP-forming)/AMP-acid ligase II [Gammaproteobacteria bacterium]
MGKLFKIAGFLPYTAMIFLNAFVDLGHKIVIQNTVFKIYDGQTQIILTAIVNALILLPFVMFLTPAGYLSDKYPKNRVMRISAWAALILTACITLFYYLGLFWLAFAMTFILAIQAAFYSPSKYGYIKELAGKEHLGQANAVVQAATTIAILAGTFIFSILFEFYLQGVDYRNDSQILLKTIAPAGWFLVFSTGMEVILAYRLPEKQPLDESMRFDWGSYKRGTYLHENFQVITKREVIFLSIIGLSIFWAIGQVLLASFPAFAKEHLGLDNTAIVQGTLACAGIGIMIGSLISGRASKGHIETGLIPIGSFGITICLFLLPGLDTPVLHIINFLLIGIFGGLFIIPLNALIQFYATEHELGRVLAGNNFIQNITMLGFLALTVLFALLGMESTVIFFTLTLVALAGALYTLYKLPQSLIRFLVSFIIGSSYSLEVIGMRNIPERGGVLMLGNHISWIDWAMIQVASPRPIRFVMYTGYYQRWYLKWFLDLFGVIPVGGGASVSALKNITAMINQGDVVCLFPEGTISQSGQLINFQRGYEKAARDAEGVILPFYIRGLWGSWFSRSSDKLKRIRKDSIKRDIVVAFGPPLPMSTTAAELKKRIFDLSIDSWQRYTDSLQPLAASWLKMIKRLGNDPAIVDYGSEPISGYKLGAAVIGFARLIKRYSPEQNLGVLLPASSAGAIANMAALLCGKTLVNLNYTASRDALAAALAQAGIRSIYTSRKFLQRLEQKGLDFSGLFTGLNIYHMEDLKAELKRVPMLVILISVRLLPAWLLKTLFCKNVALDSPAAILFSSGSEGIPKGVMLSHRNFMANLKQISDVLNTEDSDIIMATLPLFHAFGLTATTFMPLIEGIPMVCHPDPLDAVNIGKAVAKYRATILCATSTFLRLYVKNQRVHPLMFESLRIVVAGAEKLSPDVRDAFKLKFNKDIYEGYGATETTPVASVNIPNHLDVNYWNVQLGMKEGTVGMPLPGTSFRIVDPATLEELPTGTDGLILIGGAQVMLGYLQAPDKTDAVIATIEGNRWYKTGDKGHLDDDGFLTIVDRYSRFAKIGGEMISLSAVEEKIRRILAAPELELVAINMPDEKKGEKIVLMVEQDINYDQLQDDLLAAGCNPLLIPAEYLMVELIPKLGSGKTDFASARALLNKHIGNT